MIVKQLLNTLKHTYHYNTLKSLNQFTLTDHIIYILRSKDKEIIDLSFNLLSDYENIDYKNYILTKILARTYNQIDYKHKTKYIPKEYIKEITIYNAIDYINFTYSKSFIFPKPSKCSILCIEKGLPFLVPKTSYLPYEPELLNTKYINNLYTLATIGLNIYKKELIDPYIFFNKYYFNPETMNYVPINENISKSMHNHS